MNVYEILKFVIRRAIGDQCVCKLKGIMDISKRKKLGYIEISNYKTIAYGKDGEQTFFGYYDKTPFSKDDSMILGTVAKCENKKPGKDDLLLIGYYNIENPNVFNIVGETKSWCWQQGCRLQWYPKNETSLIIYNKIINNDYGAVIQNIKTREIIESLFSYIRYR